MAKARVRRREGCVEMTADALEVMPKSHEPDSPRRAFGSFWSRLGRSLGTRCRGGNHPFGFDAVIVVVNHPPPRSRTGCERPVRLSRASEVNLATRLRFGNRAHGGKNSREG